MKTIMYYIAIGPDGNIEQKIHNWSEKRYRGDLMYGLTHFDKNNIKAIFPDFKRYRTLARRNWIPNMIDILKDKRSYDIIYSPYYNGIEALIFLRGLRLFRKKIIVWQHSPIGKQNGFIRNCLYRIFLNGVDKFIFFGERTREESLQSGLISGDKCTVLRWGADLDFYNNILEETSGIEYEDVRFISTGRDNRDYEVLVSAFNGLSQKLDLYLIDEELYKKYKNAQDNITVHYIGLKNSETSSYDVGMEMAKSSVAIICSKPITNRKTSSGLTSLIEATALGKAVIVTRNKYLPEYFEENNIGLFVEPGNVEELRNAIIRISTDKKLLEQLGENSRKFAIEKCNLELFTKDLAIIFGENA